MATLASPVPGAPITGRFGDVRLGITGPHTGVDFGVLTGTPVLAPLSGSVARRWINGGGGQMLELRHTEHLSTRFAHLSRRLVYEDESVKAGQLIAYSGASGSLVRGAHLHFEVIVDGAPVDPAPYLAGNVVGAPAGGPDSFPIDEGETCPPGYAMGRIDPRLHGAIPFGPWWNRPVDDDGTALACIRSGLAVGDNTALTDVGEGVGVALAAVVPVLANVAIVGGGVLIAWGGIRRILDG